MNFRLPVLLAAAALLTSAAAAQTARYVSPSPGSSSASPSTTIVITSTEELSDDLRALNRAISVTSSSGRPYDVLVTRARDGRTLNITPRTTFGENQIVVVELAGRVSGLPDTTFRFRTVRTPDRRDGGVIPNPPGNLILETPSDMAPLTVTTSTNPAPGFLYLGPNNRITPRPFEPFITIYDSAGVPQVWSRTSRFPFELKVLPDGRIGYSEFSASSGVSIPINIIVIDSNFVAQDTLQQGRGYVTTMHDFHVLPNGNRILLGAEDVITDMSAVVDGGNPAAVVVQAVIQEVDIDGNVLFQWRSLDHIPVTDSYEDLKGATIRYIHNNAIWPDVDGNLLASMRHSSQILKINRTTGEVMWILGGKRNQFTFINENESNAPHYFSYQHDVRRLPNGNITLFDNGNQHQPRYSRAVEYQLDETTKTATLVWDYRHSPDIYVGLQGGVQTLANGHRIIGWGSAAAEGAPGVTEVDAEKNVVFEASFPSSMYVYRATKHPFWPPGRAAANVMIDEILRGNTYRYQNATDTVGLTITFTELESFFYNTTTAKRFPWAPVNPRFTGEVPHIFPVRVLVEQEGIESHSAVFRFDAEQLGLTSVADRIVVYRRDSAGKGVFVPQTTRWAPSSGEIVVDVTSAGEFAFGFAQVAPSAPLQVGLQSPKGGKRILNGSTVRLRTVLNGRADSVRIQVSENANDFESASIIDGTTSSDEIVAPLASQLSERMLYWRAMAITRDSASSWSTVDSFLLTEPFVELQRPTENVRWAHDSAYVITWETNLAPYVRLDLMKDGESVWKIRDSIPSSNAGFLWRIPVAVPVGTGYTIRVSAFGGDAEDNVTSQTTVEIYDVNMSVDDVPEVVSAIAPNPANSIVGLSLTTRVERIDVYDAVGLLAASFTGPFEQAAVLPIAELPSGTYTIVTNGSRPSARRFVIQR
ncbi:MAG TPA: hypothetical protein DIS79_10105 [Bacteroidetes bacterium]|nr:hypothetical protein [Bacteroidota bacterium]HRK04856.1 aryl-sulfate sulfotransferase [Chlorobiota bacterium]